MGIELVLSAMTASMERPSRFALVSSRKRIRSVAMRPGRMMFAVIPSRATARASVLDQPTSERRRALERPRFGIGATTPEEVLVIILPQARAFMLGSTRSVMAMTESTMAAKCLLQRLGSWPAAGVGGGPPVVLTSTSTGARAPLNGADVFVNRGEIGKVPHQAKSFTTVSLDLVN